MNKQLSGVYRINRRKVQFSLFTPLARK